MARSKSSNTLNTSRSQIKRVKGNVAKRGNPKLQGKSTNSPGYKGGKFGTNRGGQGGATPKSSFSGRNFTAGGQKFAGSGKGIGGTNRGGAAGKRSTSGFGSAGIGHITKTQGNRGSGKGRQATGYGAITKSQIMPKKGGRTLKRGG